MMQSDPIRRGAPPKVRAYRQAPWRVQTRLLAIGLASVFGLMAMLSLFIFAGAQAAEAGLRVQSLIRERDRLLRTLSNQDGELARLQSEEFLRRRARELGFQSATPRDMDYMDLPVPASAGDSFASPLRVLYEEKSVALAPAYRETLLEWVLRAVQKGGGG